MYDFTRHAWLELEYLLINSYTMARRDFSDIYMSKPEGRRPKDAGIYQENPDWPWYKYYIPLRNAYRKTSQNHPIHFI